MSRVGITGHQGLPDATRDLISTAIQAELSRLDSLHGVSSLAEGADQIFAEAVLRQGGKLTAVVPSARYEESFSTKSGEAAYWRLRAHAEEVIELPYPHPNEDAYWAAGQQVVRLADRLLAVWDGMPSGGLGGTADVVAFATQAGVPVTVVWPHSATRG